MADCQTAKTEMYPVLITCANICVGAVVATNAPAPNIAHDDIVGRHKDTKGTCHDSAQLLEHKQSSRVDLTR
jgi:hypothetical protein